MFDWFASLPDSAKATIIAAIISGSCGLIAAVIPKHPKIAIALLGIAFVCIAFSVVRNTASSARVEKQLSTLIHIETNSGNVTANAANIRRILKTNGYPATDYEKELNASVDTLTIYHTSQDESASKAIADILQKAGFKNVTLTVPNSPPLRDRMVVGEIHVCLPE